MTYLEAQYPDEVIQFNSGAEEEDGNGGVRRDLNVIENSTGIYIDVMAQFSATEPLWAENWRCQVDDDTAIQTGQFMFEIDGLNQNFFNGPNITSGDTIIQGGVIMDGKYVVASEDAIQVSTVSIDVDDRRRRKLARTTGTKSVLMVRIVGRDAQTSASEDEIRRETFDTNDPNLRTQMDGCSGGKLQMVPYNGVTSKGRFIQGGVVTLSMTSTNFNGVSMSSAEQAVRLEMLNKLGSLEQFDHIMMCIPPGTNGA